MKKRKGRGKDIRRMSFVLILTLIFWAILIIRLIQIQLINKGKYIAMAKNQYLQEVKLETQRGVIYDRNLQCLAINEPALSLGVDLRKIGNPKIIAEKLNPILKKNEATLYRQLLSGRSFMWMERDVDRELADRVMLLKIPGIHVLNETKRVYPYKKVAAQVIGFTDVDERGLSGIEYTFNRQLQGTPGLMVMQKDARGQKITEVSYPTRPPMAGKNIITTLNYIYQSIVEEELRRSIESFGADGGIVVMINPQTAEVLAMASEPGFDCNDAGKYPPGRWRNRAITDVFEPGSTFKIVINSAILEEEIKQVDDVVDCGNGHFKVLDNIIKDYRAYQHLTVGDVLVYSSNIGMVKLSLQTDRKLIYKYARNFGFGIPAGIELGGEIGGELKNPVEWSEYTPAAMAMGYEVAVTPLQLAMAYAVIANGGYLLKPKIVLDVTDGVPAKITKIKPKVIRRVISDSTVATIRHLLEQVVERGTGTKAKIEGVRICGKTGTAHKYEPNVHGYSENEFIASFVGFFPADDPQVLICTMLDNPRTSYWGGEVAAPIFKRIVQRLINVDSRLVHQKQAEPANMPRNGNGRMNFHITKLPDFTNSQVDQAQKVLAQIGLQAEYENKGEVIAKQSPAPGTVYNDSTKIKFTLFDINKDIIGYRTTPRVIGLSLRDAVNRLTLANIRAVVKGSGKVIRQNPKPGERIKAGSHCVLECQPMIRLEAFQTW